MKRALLFVGALIALTFLLTGCGPSDSQFRDVKSVVFSGNERLNKNIELSVGTVTLWLGNTVLKFIDDPQAQEARDYVRYLSKVSVGVYELQDSLTPQISTVFNQMRTCMGKYDFEPLVLVRDKGENVGIYLKNDSGKVGRELFVVVVESRQVVIVRVKGNLEKIVRAAAKNHAHEIPNLNKIFREERVI
ncbi:MAG: DUF4252 domain-containing protein [Verrucomicrobiae bacterium]|nr:DUF4252 domain-containing protein [Verrucomicrobiae bacterium]